MMVQRYFIEVAYMGTAYAGFQIQQNANSIQSEIENALCVYFKKKIALTGSSRTDAGVHAFQNFFHADIDVDAAEFVKSVYHLNAILPSDIVIRSVYPVSPEAHCRFDALSRTYQYIVYNKKDPFLRDRGYYYPYPLNMELLNKAAGIVKASTDFEVYAKKNSQVHTYYCTIILSQWKVEGGKLIYLVEANRFLRGMVRGLTGTMLKVGREKMAIDEFESLFQSKNMSKVDFSVPAQGLTLLQVKYQ